MTMIATLSLALIAFALLALATDDHHRHRIGHRSSAVVKRRMRIGAWTALALSFPCAILARGWIFGPVMWTAIIMLAAGAVFLGVNLIPASHAPGKRPS